MKSILFGSVALATLALAAPAYATSAASSDAEQPQTIIVTGQRPTAAATAEAEADLRPGNVSVVSAGEFEDRYAVTLRDMLQLTPGVIAQPRFAEEVRLSIRGSGVANNAHLRGVDLLFDGVPINGADGFGDFQELDATLASHMTVWRGANAFASGTASLGGAIEMTALNGRDAPSAFGARLDVGSFGTFRASTRLATAGERGDVLLAGSYNRADGFRSNAEQASMRGYVQAGWRWSDTVETRAGLLWNEANAKIPGALTIAAALAMPEAAASNNFNFAFARDIDSLRGWVRTSFDLGAIGTASIGGSITDRDLYHPLTSVIDQDTEDYLLFANWEGEASIGAMPLSWTLGARWRDARVDAKTFAATANRQALRGSLTGNSIQRAGGTTVYGEARLTPAENLTLVAGFNSVSTDRAVENLFNPAASDSADFSKISPKLGMVWQATPAIQLFANASALYEPPTFGQLTQGGFVDFVPIKAQEGTSLELGTRADFSRVSVELTLYQADLENEFISFQVSPLIPAATFNAPSTIHAGVEAGLTARLADDAAGGAITFKSALTWNDFRFDNDPVYRNNTLAGVPEATLVAELGWNNGPITIAPSAIIQSDTWVDFANTLRAPGYTLWNMTASWRVNDTLTLAMDGRNLTDESTISMVSSIANARAPGANLAIAVPGDGRAVFFSARVSLGAR